MGELHPKLRTIETYLKSLSARADLAVLEKLLREADFSFTDVKSQCEFCPEHYSRNLISASRWYDMLLLCWRPGQESSIHDHMGSSCAFRIVHGTSTEIQYEKIGRLRDGVELARPTNEQVYKVGELCLAQDGAIHKISNQSKTEDLVTLHIYSPPLQMNFYETETGKSGWRPPDTAVGSIRAYGN